jgi:hypothetical protein
MTGTMTPRLQVWLAAGPAAAAALAVLLFVAIELPGGSPLSLGRPQNIAEAAGLGSGAEVMRLLQAGEDPTRIYTVRPEVISPSVDRASALEAAVWSRRLELVRLLDATGALTGDLRRDIVCLAKDLEAADIVGYLDPDRHADCVEGEARQRIVTRGRNGTAE